MFNIPIFTAPGNLATQPSMKIKPPGFIHGEFFKNVITLISGTTVAQIISLAIYPALSRMYTPEDFGVDREEFFLLAWCQN